jgi:hypothetical protein
MVDVGVWGIRAGGEAAGGCSHWRGIIWRGNLCWRRGALLASVVEIPGLHQPALEPVVCNAGDEGHGLFGVGAGVDALGPFFASAGRRRFPQPPLTPTTPSSSNGIHWRDGGGQGKLEARSWGMVERRIGIGKPRRAWWRVAAGR